MIDTGCPATVGSSSRFSFMGEEFQTVPTYHGVTVENLSHYVGHKIDFLVGTDILARYQWVLDWQRETVTFYPTPREFGGTVLAVKSSWGVPIVQFTVGGKVTPALLDTGAPLQFLPPDYEAKGHSVREQEDFFPSTGTFTTPVYRLPIEFGGRRFDAEFGVLPKWLRIGLEFMGCKWILGSDVLSKWPLAFDLKNGRIHILDLNEQGRTSEACGTAVHPPEADEQHDLATNLLAKPDTKRKELK